MAAFNTALIEKIIDLNQLTNELKKKKDTDVKAADLQKLAAKSEGVLTAIQVVAEERMTPELRDLMLSVVRTVKRVRVMVEQKKPAPVTPNVMLEEVNVTFGRFVDRIVSPSTFESIREKAAYIPFVGNVINLMATLPSRWNRATDTQKMALTLGAVIVLASLALTIAIWAAPALATIPVLGTAIACISGAALWLYSSTVRKVDERTKDEGLLKDTLSALEEQDKLLRELLKKCPASKNPAPEKLASVTNIRRTMTHGWKGKPRGSVASPTNSRTRLHRHSKSE